MLEKLSIPRESFNFLQSLQRHLVRPRPWREEARLKIKSLQPILQWKLMGMLKQLEMITLLDLANSFEFILTNEELWLQAILIHISWASFQMYVDAPSEYPKIRLFENLKRKIESNFSTESRKMFSYLLPNMHRNESIKMINMWQESVVHRTVQIEHVRLPILTSERS